MTICASSSRARISIALHSAWNSIRGGAPEQHGRVGDQTGGRVFLFLHTDDFDRTVEQVQTLGGRLTEAVRHEVYGRVVVFLDLYGNKWDLVGHLTCVYP